MMEKILNTRTQDGSSEHMRATFRVFDRNDDGYIQVDELKSAMKALGNKVTDKELDDMVRKTDTDGDGQISYEEFFKMLTN